MLLEVYGFLAMRPGIGSPLHENRSFFCQISLEKKSGIFFADTTLWTQSESSDVIKKVTLKQVGSCYKPYFSVCESRKI